MQGSHCLVFEAFRLDLHDERLWRHQEVLHLHPKTFAVLACLVTQAGQLVTKDTLLAAVWPETVVSESVVTVAMRQLRRVLGDQARPPRFIETIHGRGYRFIAQASAATSGADWTLWLLGYPGQGLARCQQMLRLARALSHPFSLAHALNSAAGFYQDCRDAPAVHEYAVALHALAAAQGFRHMSATAQNMVGWALAAQGKP